MTHANRLPLDPQADKLALLLNAVRLILSLCGAALLLAATAKYGIGLSGDSLDYLGTADHLAAGLGFVDFSGEAFIFWPPLYPLLLAGIKLSLGIDPMIAARFLNALAFAAFIYLTGSLVGACLPGKPHWQALGSYLALISLPYLSIAAQISSDPLFIDLTLVFLLFAIRYLKDGSRLALGGMLVSAALGGVLRWHGMVLILCAGLFAFLARRAHPRQAAWQAFLAWLASGLPLLAWVFVRNLAQHGSLFGPGRDFSPDLFSNLIATVDRVMHWLVPLSLTQRIPAFVFLLLAISLAVLTLRQTSRLQAFAKRMISLPLYPVLIFSGVYLIFLITTANTQEQPGYVSDRYQAVLFSEILILAFAVLDELIQAAPWERIAAGRWAAAGVILLWSLYPAYASYKFVYLSRQHEVGSYNMYNTAFQHQSPLVAYLDSGRLDPSLALYSNLPEVVYAFTRRTTLRSPHDPQQYPETRDYLEQFTGWPGDQPAYLVWIEPNTRRNYFTPQELSTLAEVIPVVVYDKYGGIYLVKAK